MLELGASSEVEHQAIVDYLESKYLKAILVGKFYQTKSGFTTFKDILELIPFLKQSDLENSLVLLKGSRGIKLEMLLKEKYFLDESRDFFITFFVAAIFIGGITIGYKLYKWNMQDFKEKKERIVK